MQAAKKNVETPFKQFFTKQTFGFRKSNLASKEKLLVAINRDVF